MREGGPTTYRTNSQRKHRKILKFFLPYALTAFEFSVRFAIDEWYWILQYPLRNVVKLIFVKIAEELDIRQIGQLSMRITDKALDYPLLPVEVTLVNLQN